MADSTADSSADMVGFVVVAVLDGLRVRRVGVRWRFLVWWGGVVVKVEALYTWEEVQGAKKDLGLGPGRVVAAGRVESNLVAGGETVP